MSSEFERVTVYTDGFNLYFGMMDAGLESCRWLDLSTLAASLLRPGQMLSEIHYFTSRVSNNPDKQKRQTVYIEALETKNISIIYGHYQQSHIECKSCGHIWPNYDEKMTDVNIASRMLIDAFQDKFDMALLISGDSDLVPPIRAIHQLFAKKRVFVAFPPARHNASLRLHAKGSMILGKKKLRDNQLPSEIKKRDGYVLRKPATW